jgi:hypothetical protein
MARYGADAGEERSLAELFSETTAKLQLLVRKELELAKLEVKDQVGTAAKAGAMLATAAVAGLVAVLMLCMAAAWGLAEVIPTGFAFLAVGVVLVVFAAGAAKAGQSRLRAVSPVPGQTARTIKDDVEVAKASLSRGASTP